MAELFGSALVFLLCWLVGSGQALEASLSRPARPNCQGAEAGSTWLSDWGDWNAPPALPCYLLFPGPCGRWAVYRSPHYHGIGDARALIRQARDRAPHLILEQLAQGPV